MVNKMFFKRFFVQCLLIVLVFSPTMVFAAKRSKSQHRKCVILESRNVGMFSIFFDVIALLKSYEEGVFSYVEVDFAQTGLYYDQACGPNWWEYYFQPIKLGSIIQRPQRVLGLSAGINPWNIELKTSEEEVNRLIKKYISIDPGIQDEINAFVNQYFQQKFVIGIHYRGTDKMSEAPRIPYEIMTKHILNAIDSLSTDNYKIFVATDEQAFLNHMISLFQDKVCWVQDVERATDNKPIHCNKGGGHYLSGKYALIDCILLSKTNLIIRTSSNLSKASTFFNPQIHVIEISQRH